VGKGSIVTEKVELPIGLHPLAGIVYVIVYVAGRDAETSIKPVDAFMLKPAVDEYVPPVVNPVVGLGPMSGSFTQTLGVYVNPVTGVVDELTLTHVSEKQSAERE
jgi:hypothetical protein